MPAASARSFLPISRSLPASAVTVRSIDRPRLDWLTLYEQSLTAMEVGRRFVVAPERGLIKASDRLPIIIP